MLRVVRPRSLIISRSSSAVFTHPEANWTRPRDHSPVLPLWRDRTEPHVTTTLLVLTHHERGRHQAGMDSALWFFDATWMERYNNEIKIHVANSGLRWRNLHREGNRGDKYVSFYDLPQEAWQITQELFLEIHPDESKINQIAWISYTDATALPCILRLPFLLLLCHMYGQNVHKLIYRIRKYVLE